MGCGGEYISVVRQSFHIGVEHEVKTVALESLVDAYVCN
jgi:hypothetical protein